MIKILCDRHSEEFHGSLRRIRIYMIKVTYDLNAQDRNLKLIVPADELILKNPKRHLCGKDLVLNEVDLRPECREKIWDWLHNKEDVTPEE